MKPTAGKNGELHQSEKRFHIYFHITLMEKHNSLHRLKMTGFPSIEVHTACELIGVKGDGMVARFLVSVDEGRYLLALCIVDSQNHIFAMRQTVANDGRWIEWIGIVMFQLKFPGRDVLIDQCRRDVTPISHRIGLNTIGRWH
jgi:hypothetical protein